MIQILKIILPIILIFQTSCINIEIEMPSSKEEMMFRKGMSPYELQVLFPEEVNNWSWKVRSLEVYNLKEHNYINPKEYFNEISGTICLFYVKGSTLILLLNEDVDPRIVRYEFLNKNTKLKIMDYRWFVEN